MINANVKMMDRIAEIENCVLGGFVFDDRGNWVSISDKKASEEDFLAHLEAGRVLHNGQWVKIADAKKGPSAPAAPPADNNYPPETVVVTFTPAAPPQHPEPLPRKTSEEETSIVPYPPETKSILVQSPAPQQSEISDDAVSSYAMETGLFVIDRSVETDLSQTLQSETKPAMAVQPAETPVPAPAERKTKTMPVFVPPSIPTWEKEESRQKKRTFIIGAVIVAVTGIAAIAVLLMQIFLK
jgi:hypothetical protein